MKYEPVEMKSDPFFLSRMLHEQQVQDSKRFYQFQADQFIQQNRYNEENAMAMAEARFIMMKAKRNERSGMSPFTIFAVIILIIATLSSCKTPKTALSVENLKIGEVGSSTNAIALKNYTGWNATRINFQEPTHYTFHYDNYWYMRVSRPDSTGLVEVKFNGKTVKWINDSTFLIQTKP